MSDPHIIGDDPRLSALLAWREKLIEHKAVSRSAFKEAHVRLVLRSGRTGADQIRVMLPAMVAEHADEMSRVLQDAIESTASANQTAATTQHVAAVVSAPQSGFAPYTFGDNTLGDTQREPAAISLRRLQHDDTGRPALEVTWPPYVAPATMQSEAMRRSGAEFQPATMRSDAPCVIYRLVSSEGDRAYSPDNADLVEATVETAATDDRRPAGAVRHLQVWVNIGASIAEALEAQPVLHAAGVVIGTLQDVEIREDSGSVIGNWPALPGVRAVHVYRIPADLADSDGPAFRIAASELNLTGFVDFEAERGRRYTYRVRCEVEVDGIVRLSEAVETEISISAVRHPVTDLTETVRSPRDGVVFDLEWTTPQFGRVLVFRTPGPPDAAAPAADVDESVLHQLSLGRDVELTHPVVERVDQRGARKTVMTGVAWPEGWSHAYFTPVTVLDGRARLGKTISVVRTGTITDVVLMQYCHKVVLTFDWPDGAVSVLVFITPKGHDPRQGMTGRSYEIAMADYKKYGGMRFAGNLPQYGCAIHLVPVAFSGGRRVLGVPATIEYGGLLRLRYHVEISRDRNGLPQTAAVSVQADENTNGAPPFVLVNNPGQIPLSINDGTAVNMSRADRQGQPTCEEFHCSTLTTTGGEVWVGDVRGLQGWVRLFANLPPERLRMLALLDPPVENLRLTPWSP